jgi:hypothetical protein
MSSDTPITRAKLNEYLKELGKEFRKLNGSKTHAEIILVGGAAVLSNYSFRDMTYDVDAVILASSAMKEAINHVGDRLGLPTGWLNADFTRTESYSGKLYEVSVHYRTFSNILQVRTVAAEYLIAMKLMSGRQYKYDLSDIAGILLEHQQRGEPIRREAVDAAIKKLYGEKASLPSTAQIFIDDAFKSDNYKQIYSDIREQEKRSKAALLEFKQEYPDVLKTEDADNILAQLKRKRDAAKEP